MKMYYNVCNKYRKFKTPKITFKKNPKKQIFLLITVNVVMNIKKYLKKKNQLKY